MAQLSKLYRDACRDLERERIAGRAAQEETEKLHDRFRALEDSTVRSAFVLVLIDADADAYLVRTLFPLQTPAANNNCLTPVRRQVLSRRPVQRWRASGG